MKNTQLARFLLKKFTKNDLPELFFEIPSPEFQITWGGFGLDYPLTPEQFQPLLDSADLPEPRNLLFKFFDSESRRTAGHIELLRIDHLIKTLWLGRVLIFSHYRGKGLGTSLINETLKLVFREMKFEKVSLNVFDYNTPAIKCYEASGFRKEEYHKDSRTVNGINFSHYCMSITKEEYLEFS